MSHIYIHPSFVLCISRASPSNPLNLFLEMRISSFFVGGFMRVHCEHLPFSREPNSIRALI